MNAAAAAIMITSKSKDLGQNVCAVTEERRIMRRERGKERAAKFGGGAAFKWNCIFLYNGVLA